MGDNVSSLDSSIDLPRGATVNKSLNMSAPINKYDDADDLSEDGEHYHPKQDPNELVSKPDSGNGVLIEVFPGKKDTDPEHVANLVINELLQSVDDVNELGVIYTGMLGEFNDVLQDVVDDRDLNITVEICYPNIRKYIDAGIADYKTAWKELYNKRNRQLAREHVDIAVSVSIDTEAGSRTFTQNMLRLGVKTMNVNLTDKF